jgi:hypothetical protein
MTSAVEKAADDFLDGLLEATYGKEGKARAVTIVQKINKDLNPAYPRFIPVVNLAPPDHPHIDGIAPGEYGVTNRQKWSRYFKEIDVQMPPEEAPKPKTKAKAKRKEAQTA